MTVRVDPHGACWSWRWEWEIQETDGLPRSTTHTDRGDPIADALDRGGDTQNGGLGQKLELLIDLLKNPTT